MIYSDTQEEINFSMYIVIFVYLICMTSPGIIIGLGGSIIVTIMFPPMILLPIIVLFHYIITLVWFIFIYSIMMCVSYNNNDKFKNQYINTRKLFDDDGCVTMYGKFYK